MDPRSCASRRLRSLLGWAVCLEVAVLWAGESQAQYLQNYFPEGVPGYDKEMGVTVLSGFGLSIKSPACASTTSSSGPS